MSERVEVVDGDTGHVLFTGTLADTKAPWMFWSRVIPDPGHIDLPPKYKIRKIAP